MLLSKENPDQCQKKLKIMHSYWFQKFIFFKYKYFTISVKDSFISYGVSDENPLLPSLALYFLMVTKCSCNTVYSSLRNAMRQKVKQQDKSFKITGNHFQSLVSSWWTANGRLVYWAVGQIRVEGSWWPPVTNFLIYALHNFINPTRVTPLPRVLRAYPASPCN